jgi:hypothetical protein
VLDASGLRVRIQYLEPTNSKALYPKLRPILRCAHHAIMLVSLIVCASRPLAVASLRAATDGGPGVQTQQYLASDGV